MMDERGFGAGRRKLLRAALLATLSFTPLASVRAQPADRRRLSFVHTHTGETLSTVYYEDGIYQPASLERIDNLLRDFRTQEVHRIDPQLLDILFDLKNLVNRDTPYSVISAYRSPQTNAMLHSRSSAVAEHSLHMQGRAIDVRVMGFPTKTLRDLALALKRGGVGYYETSDFVHVDSGRVRSW